MENYSVEISIEDSDEKKKRNPTWTMKISRDNIRSKLNVQEDCGVHEIVHYR